MTSSSSVSHLSHHLKACLPHNLCQGVCYSPPHNPTVYSLGIDYCNTASWWHPCSLDPCTLDKCTSSSARHCHSVCTFVLVWSLLCACLFKQEHRSDVYMYNDIGQNYIPRTCSCFSSTCDCIELDATGSDSGDVLCWHKVHLVRDRQDLLWNPEMGHPLYSGRLGLQVRIGLILVWGVTGR